LQIDAYLIDLGGSEENKLGEILVDKDKLDTFVIDVKFSMLCVNDCASDLPACACA
jgi:hypothetical protein